jgi:hypothetical protein
VDVASTVVSRWMRCGRLRAWMRLGLGGRCAGGSFERAFAAPVCAREDDEGFENRDARIARVI